MNRGVLYVEKMDLYYLNNGMYDSGNDGFCIDSGF